jgi:hypothetical protein
VQYKSPVKFTVYISSSTIIYIYTSSNNILYLTSAIRSANFYIYKHVW